jgi:hypothetical protein
MCDSITNCEKEHMPAHANRRKLLRKKYDPNDRFRISENTDAFAVSMTSDYAITAHDDCGLTSETIGFVNRNGPLPGNHSWNFGAGGCLHPLPDAKGKASVMFIDSDAVLHGTLPTSKTEATYNHGNIGAALVTKKEMINSIKRKNQRFRDKDDPTKEYMIARNIFHR